MCACCVYAGLSRHTPHRVVNSTPFIQNLWWIIILQWRSWEQKRNKKSEIQYTSAWWPQGVYGRETWTGMNLYIKFLEFHKLSYHFDAFYFVKFFAYSAGKKWNFFSLFLSPSSSNFFYNCMIWLSHVLFHVNILEHFTFSLCLVSASSASFGCCCFVSNTCTTFFSPLFSIVALNETFFRFVAQTHSIRFFLYPLILFHYYIYFFIA